MRFAELFGAVFESLYLALLDREQYATLWKQFAPTLTGL
jgi:hypothetical protein